MAGRSHPPSGRWLVPLFPSSVSRPLGLWFFTPLTTKTIGQYVGALKRVVESSPVVKKSPVDDETDLIKLALFWETKRITNGEYR